MNRYCLGFIFTDDTSQVVLIRKNKPSWQAGLLNGIGGSIEAGESAIQAMTREAKEEAGVVVKEDLWHHFATMKGGNFEVSCFKVINSELFSCCVTRTSEKIEQTSVVLVDMAECVSNVLWLIEMARDHNHGHPFMATIQY